MSEPADIRRCRVSLCRDPSGEPRRLDDDHLVCRGCRVGAASDMPRLAPMYIHLHTKLTPAASALGERVAGPGFASTSPVRDAALHAMDDLWRWAVQAEREVRGACGLNPPITEGRPVVRLVRAMSIMAAHIDQATMHPAGVFAVTGARLWRHRLERLLGWDRLVVRLPAPCAYCSTQTLVRRDGDGYVTCTRCRRTWLEAEYRLLVRLIIEEATA